MEASETCALLTSADAVRQTETSAEEDSDASTKMSPVMTTVSTQTDDYDIEDDDDDACYYDLQSEDVLAEIYDERYEKLEADLLIHNPNMEQ